MYKRLLVALFLIGLLFSGCKTEDITPTLSGTITTEPVDQAPSQQDVIVISEILAGITGDNNHEFIELHNPTNQIIDLNGWQLNYKRTDTDEEIVLYKWDKLTLVPPAGFYLLLRDGTDLGIIADGWFDVPLATSKGGLRLIKPDGSVADTLVWGDGPEDYQEGGRAQSFSADSSLARKFESTGLFEVDTGNNSADFEILSNPTPANSGHAFSDSGIALNISAPASASPGDSYNYSLEAINISSSNLQNVELYFPVPQGIEFVNASEDIEFTGGMIVWSIPDLPKGETVSLEVEVNVPWTYLVAEAASYYAIADGMNQPVFGEPVRTDITQGLIPVNIAKTLVGSEITIEGTATMYTGGYYAGGGNTKFYIEDGTGGMQVWVPDGDGEVDVALGSVVQARGMLEIYRGAYELICNPQDVEVIQLDGEEWVPERTTILEAATNKNILPGRLVEVEGYVTRADEMSYSFEIDLMDEDGQILTVYIDKLTEMSIETIEVGRLYNAIGIIEVVDTMQRLNTRVQSDLTEIYPPVLRLEVDAPITIAPGEVFSVTFTAYNHTAEPLTDVVIQTTLPAHGTQLNDVSENGVVDLRTIKWVIPSLGPNGDNTSVSYSMHTLFEDGHFVLEDFSATAANFADTVTSIPHFIFLGETVPIWAIQGPGFRTAYVLDRVTTQGVVTGVFPELEGFWIQETQTDDDSSTSGAIFVSTGIHILDLSPGDEVTVSGIVREAFQQTQLQLTHPDDVQILSQGNALPIPVSFDPPKDEGDAEIYNESLEGMLVQVAEDAIAVSPTSKYGEYTLVLPYHGIERLWQGEINGMAIRVDDGSGGTHDDRSALAYVVHTGDIVSGLVGPLAYTYGDYKIEPITFPTIVHEQGEMVNFQPIDDHEYAIMTWNVENLFDFLDPHPSSPAMQTLTEYKNSLTKIANTILASGVPTIIGLQEVENIGILEDIAAHELLTDYSLIPILLEGTDSRGIDNGYLIRGDRAEVLEIAQHNAPQGITSRPPLMVKVSVGDGVEVYVLNNHFTSMSGGEEATEPRRTAQASWNASVAQQIHADDPDALIAIIGDLNSYLDSLPINTIIDSGFIHVMDWLPENDRYTYNYQGEMQVLDHILINAGLADFVGRVYVLHTNADFPPPDPSDDSPLRKSDHDPLITVFELP